MSEAMITSGQKISRKVRQQYKRDLRKDVRKFIQAHLRALKPKPRFLPLWWWKRRVQSVIDVEQLRKGGYPVPEGFEPAKEEDES